LLIGSLLVAFVIAESVARSIRVADTVHENEPTMHEFDPDLGWTNKPGRYEFASYAPGGDPVRVTFLENRARRTRAGQSAAGDARPKLVLIGGSYTQGFAISDEETFAWRLQQRFRNFEVLNYGTGAYGTYQTLLRLERLLPELSNPALVVYGFIEHHELRNVAPASWISVLARNSERGHLAVPFATLDEAGALVRRPPDSFAAFPLSKELAMMALAEQATMALRTRGRLEQRRPVTEALLRRMAAVSAAHGAKFRVVLLEAEPATIGHYEEFLAGIGIPVALCAFPLTPEMRVRGEGHPNPRMHTRWARCIERFLRRA